MKPVPVSPDSGIDEVRQALGAGTSVSTQPGDKSQENRSKHPASPAMGRARGRSAANSPLGQIITGSPSATDVALPTSSAGTPEIPGPLSALPIVTATFGTLAQVASSYGFEHPTSDTGQLPLPAEPAFAGPSGPIAWDSRTGSEYSARGMERSGRAQAIANLDAELAQILDTTAGRSIDGQATVAAIVAEVNSALTALGTIDDSPMGQHILTAVLQSALQRADRLFARNHSSAETSAQQIANLANHYLEQAQRDPRGGTGRPWSADGLHGGLSLTRPAGHEAQWIDEALRVLRDHGYDTSRINPADIATIIQHESAGNPGAINLWDSNAAAGHPSKGLMQTIDSTFDAYALPGHQNIWDPVDNIIAGVRYAIARYGSTAHVPGVAQVHRGGSYTGY